MLVTGAARRLGREIALALAAAGWRVAIGCWGALSLIALLVWLPRLRGSAERQRVAPAKPAGSMWTSPVAWQVAFFMGTQSTGFYLLVNWLPTVERAIGAAVTTTSSPPIVSWVSGWS